MPAPRSPDQTAAPRKRGRSKLLPALLITAAITLLALLVDVALFYLVPADEHGTQAKWVEGHFVATAGGGVAVFFLALSRITVAFKAILAALGSAAAILLVVSVSPDLVEPVPYPAAAPPRFAEPPPPPSAAVHPPLRAPAARSLAVPPLFVFFRAQNADLPQTGEAVIRLAAGLIQTNGASHITLTGHADPTLGAEGSQALAERRAVEVKSALVRHGIDASMITVEGVVKSDGSAPEGLSDGKVWNNQVSIEAK